MVLQQACGRVGHCRHFFWNAGSTGPAFLFFLRRYAISATQHRFLDVVGQDARRLRPAEGGSFGRMPNEVATRASAEIGKPRRLRADRQSTPPPSFASGSALRHQSGAPRQAVRNCWVLSGSLLCNLAGRLVAVQPRGTARCCATSRGGSLLCNLAGGLGLRLPTQNGAKETIGVVFVRSEAEMFSGAEARGQ
jgi:hypothetical protein